MAKAKHGKPKCPKCGSTDVIEIHGDGKDKLSYYCNKCGHNWKPRKRYTRYIW